MDKIIIQEDDTSFTVYADDTVIGVLEEELHQLGIAGVSTSYGKSPRLEVAKDQGGGPDAFDKGMWLDNAISDRRPSGFSNWETFFLAESLSQDENTPQGISEVARYYRMRMAPQEFYEVFEAEPRGDPRIIVWAEVAEALKR